MLARRRRVAARQSLILFLRSCYPFDSFISRRALRRHGIRHGGHRVAICDLSRERDNESWMGQPPLAMTWDAPSIASLANFCARNGEYMRQTIGGFGPAISLIEDG
jgi:hypothetical protein